MDDLKKLPMPHVEPVIATKLQVQKLIDLTGKYFSFVIDSLTPDGFIHLTLIYRHNSYVLLKDKVDAIFDE